MNALCKRINMGHCFFVVIMLGTSNHTSIGQTQFLIGIDVWGPFSGSILIKWISTKKKAKKTINLNLFALFVKANIVIFKRMSGVGQNNPRIEMKLLPNNEKPWPIPLLLHCKIQYTIQSVKYLFCKFQRISSYYLMEENIFVSCI